MTIDFHLRVVGALMLVLAIVHAFFPRWFGWREDLAKLSLINRQIFVVHTLFVVVVLAMLGVLMIFYANPLLRSGEVGRAVFFGLGVFWAIRLVVQIWYYKSELWRGHRGKTGLHVLAVALCLYFTGTCFVAGFLTAKG